MILLDLTTAAITVEPDGDVDHLVSVRTLQTADSTSRVAYYGLERTRVSEHTPADQELEESVRSRQGTNVMREYDIDQPGVYALTSGAREVTNRHSRTFYIRVEFIDTEIMQISVLPGSFARIQWVFDDDLHTYEPGETFAFQVRVTHAGVATADGEITRIESDRTGVKYERATAWERLMADDDPNSV